MRSEKSAPGALLLNLLLLYIVYGITRLAFFLENYATYEHLVGADGWWSIVVGGLYFDTSAIAYTNALYVLLVLLPIPQKEGPLWQRICKWLFVVVNSLGLAMNLGDSVYFQYTARRTTIAFFSEFSGDEKLGSIVGYEFIQHWYLVLLFLVLAAPVWPRSPAAVITSASVSHCSLPPMPSLPVSVVGSGITAPSRSAPPISLSSSPMMPH